MRVGIVIPTRGDRPEFLENCKRMLRDQRSDWASKIYAIIVTPDMVPVSEECDITPRYRFGYDYMTGFDVDVIAFMEDDDYYSPNYLRTMVRAWDEAGRPELFGIRYSIYYHLKLKKYFRMQHDQRSAMMCTLIRPNLKFTWPIDTDPFTDQWLWMRNNNGIKEKVLFSPDKLPCIGIKHGMTKTGGKNHVDFLHRYKMDDPDMQWLCDNTDPFSFEFYRNLSLKLNENY